ncbi:MAG: ATP-grasp domain-containing protein, partial [Myxococcales bacterium]|nr:ATP-grasp domain-containing protein [Myxococcales bacterium]
MPPAAPHIPAGAAVLVVGAGPFQLGLIEAVQARGLRVVVVDRNADAPGMRAADVAEPCDIIDVPAVVAVARRHRVVAVASSASDAAMPAVAGVAEALDLPGQRPAVIQTCRNKLLTYQAVAAAGLPVPATVAVASPAEAMAAVDDVGSYPVVIKPRSAAGGRGVSIVRSFSELGPAFARAEAAGRGSGVLVQGFVGGESVGVEAVFWQGELLDAFVLVDTYREGFVSPVGHALPCPWPAERQAAVAAAAAGFAKACGLTHGQANFDLRDA